MVRWLGRRMAALRCLSLRVVNTGGPLADSLAGSPLKVLHWHGVQLPGGLEQLCHLASLCQLELTLGAACARPAGDPAAGPVAGQASAPGSACLALPSTLERLSLSAERFSSDLGPLLCSGTGLRQLRLSRSSECAPGLDVDAVLPKLTGLSSLELFSWDLSQSLLLPRAPSLDSSHAPLPSPGRLPGLTHLGLAWCDLRALPPALCDLGPTLRSLDLSHNHLLGGFMEDTPPLDAAFAPLAHLTRLTHLRLDECGLEALPSELAAPACSLLNLDASRNPGLGHNIYWQGRGGGLPGRSSALSPLSTLSQLTGLHLGRCRLGGLPKELAALAGTLEHLELEGNNCNEGLGPVSQLTALTYLGLSNCDLREWPAQAVALPKLKVS